jgi:DNA-binding response OmpR family regulator
MNDDSFMEASGFIPSNSTSPQVLSLCHWDRSTPNTRCNNYAADDKMFILPIAKQRITWLEVRNLEMTYHHSMRLLLVEDELEIQGFLKQSLSDAGYEVDSARDGKTALQFAAGKRYDVLVVDLGLPDQDGIDLILQLRRSGVSSPVLILSARRSVDDRVKGLEQGGDDYLTKPFALAELLARLRNLLRRNLAASKDATRLRVLDLELDFIKRRASRAGEVLNLSPQEFVLLEYLCRHAGRVVTRSMLLSEVWGMRIQPDTNVVDVHIYRLRGKVDTEGREPLIKTLRGIGYVLKDG